MIVSEEELLKEKKYLNTTREIIKTELELKHANVNKQEDNIYEINKYVWQNISSLTADIDSIEQSFLDSKTELMHKEVLSDVKKISLLKKAYKNAYFGRIDFKTKKETSEIYIGITSVNNDNDFQVYDWRSPISSMFYNYGIGDASYEAPYEKINGEILLKRQFKINNDQIIRCFDSSINIDDDYLQEILSESKSSKMTNIVNTIQIDQNKIIRNEKDKYLIVQGLAGSGKTSVALHRIAYLLYKDLKLNSNNILILSPNELFSIYISNVLPELGEDNVLQTTFNSFFTRFIENKYKCENFIKFYERTNCLVDNEMIKYKFSSKIYDDLNDFINMFKGKLHYKSGFTIKRKHFTQEEINSYLILKLHNLNIPEKVNRTAEHICDVVGLSYRKYKNQIKKSLMEMLNFKTDIISLYNLFIKYLRKYKNIDLNEIEDEQKLNFEDLSILLYIKFELFGYPYDIKIRHIVIDEAQDYSYLQYVLLRKIFAKASYTILGDVNQCINTFINYHSINELSNIFKNAKYIELNKTYRSSEEIINYSNKLLNLNNTCAVRNNMNIDVINRLLDKKDMYNSLIDDIKLIQNNGFKNIAIITKDIVSADNLYRKLINSNIKVSLLKEKNIEEMNDIVIVPSILSKGLEFEAVIVYNTIENKYLENEKKLLYVVCTRAQHQLIVYNN